MELSKIKQKLGIAISAGIVATLLTLVMGNGVLAAGINSSSPGAVTAPVSGSILAGRLTTPVTINYGTLSNGSLPDATHLGTGAVMQFNVGFANSSTLTESLAVTARLTSPDGSTMLPGTYSFKSFGPGATGTWQGTTPILTQVGTYRVSVYLWAQGGYVPLDTQTFNSAFTITQQISPPTTITAPLLHTIHLAAGYNMVIFDTASPLSAVVAFKSIANQVVGVPSAKGADNRWRIINFNGAGTPDQISTLLPHMQVYVMVANATDWTY